MATPIGHAVAGYAIYGFSAAPRCQEPRKLLILALFAANAPDLDFVPGILINKPALYHQGITHSLGFAFMVSLAAAGVFRLWGTPFCTAFNLCFLSFLSHLALDFFGPDRRPPFGEPLFWPFSEEHFISSVAVFWGTKHAASTHSSTLEWINAILDLYNLRAIAIEFVIVAPFVFLANRYKRGLRAQAGTS